MIYHEDVRHTQARKLVEDLNNRVIAERAEFLEKFKGEQIQTKIEEEYKWKPSLTDNEYLLLYRISKLEKLIKDQSDKIDEMSEVFNGIRKFVVRPTTVYGGQ